MRIRALPLLLVLTGGDYALWDWSIAEGHDIVSLISGLTLVPLLAATLAMLAVGAARLVGFLLERPSASHRHARARARGHNATESPAPSPAGEVAERERRSRRLAA